MKSVREIFEKALGLIRGTSADPVSWNGQAAPLKLSPATVQMLDSLGKKWTSQMKSTPYYSAFLGPMQELQDYEPSGTDEDEALVMWVNMFQHTGHFSSSAALEDFLRQLIGFMDDVCEGEVIAPLPLATIH